MLSDYPINVQRIVADPRSAILARFREIWPFTERVRRACEDLHGVTRRIAEWKDGARKQLAERDERDRELAAPRVDLKAKYGENYGLTVSVLPDDNADKIKRLNRMARYSQQVIEREYAARGEEPKQSHGIVFSRSLVESIKQTSADHVELGATADADR